MIATAPNTRSGMSIMVIPSGFIVGLQRFGRVTAMVIVQTEGVQAVAHLRAACYAHT